MSAQSPDDNHPQSCEASEHDQSAAEVEQSGSLQGSLAPAPTLAGVDHLIDEKIARLEDRLKSYIDVKFSELMNWIGRGSKLEDLKESKS